MSEVSCYPTTPLPISVVFLLLPLLGNPDFWEIVFNINLIN
jgi:hypothetical protein